MPTITKFLMSIAVLVALAGTGFADALDDAIKARQAHYQVVKFNAGGLFAMAKGDVDYDAKQAQAYADNLKALTLMMNGAMWPAGSDNVAKKGKTRAKENIWSTWPAIQEKSDAFKSAAADMAGAAGAGLDQLRSKAGALGASCKGCHDTYRAKDF